MITGGASGIGLAIARELAGRGCRLLIASRDRAKVGRAVSEMPGSIGFSGCDVRRREAIDALWQRADEALGGVDILVTSAGIARSSLSTHHLPQAVAQLDEAVWDDILDTNLRGVFYTVRAAAQRMVAQQRGQIVNISSARAARRGLGFGAGYCASKRAALALLDALAAEVAPQGVRVFSFLPDVVETGMIAGTQLNKQGSLLPEEVGRLVAELLAAPGQSQWDSPLLVPIRPRAWQRPPETGT